MTECPTSGKWGWNESHNHLEFCSSIEDEATPRDSKKNNGFVMGVGVRRGRPNRTPIVREEIKPNKHHTTVTLMDVKKVARFMISEIEHVGEEFDTMFRTQQLDDLLYLLLNYFEIFFERKDAQGRPSPIHIEDSPEQRRLVLDLNMKMEGTKKHLGRAYGILIMGIGMCEMHHMNCGKSRVSNSYRDNNMYEAFYLFCSFVVWITYKRRDFEAIRIETNRVLRANAFNPTLRQKAARDFKEISQDENGLSSEAALKGGQAFYRRAMGKRPSKKEIENMRSTVMCCIIPLPKEESEYLFIQKTKFPEQSKEAFRRSNMTVEEQLEEVVHMGQIKVNKTVGILGESLKLFNLLTLSSLEDEPKEEERSIRISLSDVASGTGMKDSNGAEQESQHSAGTTVQSSATTTSADAASDPAAAVNAVEEE